MRGGAIFGLILILVGGAALLANMGYLGIDLWDVLWRLWPVILIYLGIERIVRALGV